MRLKASSVLFTTIDVLKQEMRKKMFYNSDHAEKTQILFLIIKIDYVTCKSSFAIIFVSHI